MPSADRPGPMSPAGLQTVTCPLTLCPQVTYGSFDYTSLLYLSDYLDDFSGGRFVFMEEGANRTVEPRAGRSPRRRPRDAVCPDPSAGPRPLGPLPTAQRPLEPVLPALRRSPALPQRDAAAPGT